MITLRNNKTTCPTKHSAISMKSYHIIINNCNIH